MHDVRLISFDAAWINRYDEAVPPLDEEFASMRFPDLRTFVAGLDDIGGCR